jgi:putative spermidine/putrescine transport system substrate-binding protein
MYLAQGLIFLIVILLISSCGSPNTTTSSPNSHPVTLQIIDAGGFMPQAKPMIEAFKKAHPELVSNVIYLDRVQAPALAGKIKTQQDAHNVQISLILSGYDGVAATTQAGVVEPLTPAHNDMFPNLDQNYQPAAKAYKDLANGYGLVFSYTPSGPIFEYDPTKISNPPTTIEGLRAWIKANPHQFLYARPANSGPGRTMLMGLPYLLGDKDPQDPTNGWDNTWSFLHDIGSTIDSYPTRTSDVMSELAKGEVSMVASTFGWDINPRILHQVPEGDKTFVLQDTTFVSDAAFMLMPKGLDQDHQKTVLSLMAWMLKPDQQAYNYDSGYFYPGPAVKNVPLSSASASSKQLLGEFGRTEYDTIIKNAKIVLPLATAQLNAAFSKWDHDIGGGKYKTA